MDDTIKVEGKVESTSLNESDIEDYPETPQSDEEETENSSDTEESDLSEEATETESKSEEPQVDIQEEKHEEPKVDRQFYFNGRMLTPEELFEESNRLNAEFTKRSQRLAELEKSKETSQEDPLKDYDPDEVNNFKKIASQLGFVRKEDLEKENHERTQKEILDTFLGKHPEYKDPAKSAQLFEQLEGYNTNLKYLPQSLEKAHSEITPNKKVDINSEKNKAKINETKVSRMANGVNSGVKKSDKDNLYTSEQISVMKKMGVWEEE